MLYLLVVKQWPYEAAAIAFEAIPRTLAQNCGVNVIRTMTALQGKVWTFFVACFYRIRALPTDSTHPSSVYIVSNSLLQHANGENAWIGIDGNTGEITDMKERKV